MNLSNFLGCEPTLDNVAQLAVSAHEEAMLAQHLSIFALSVAIIAVIVALVA